jgi:hypothetical protein
MAYATPTAEDFKTRFPEFGTVSDSLVTAIIAEQEPQVGDTWIDADRRPALMYLVAHLLNMSGYPAPTAEAAVINAQRGQMKRRKVGDVETEYAGTSSAANASASDIYSVTFYGRMFLSYLRRNFAPFAVV